MATPSNSDVGTTVFFFTSMPSRARSGSVSKRRRSKSSRDAKRASTSSSDSSISSANPSSSSIKVLMLGVLVQRLLTFSLNSILLRYVSADVFGFAASDMEVLLSTILFLSREGFRIVSLRFPSTLFSTDFNSSMRGRKNESSFVLEQQRYLINLAYIPAFIGVCMSVLAAILTIFLHSSESSSSLSDSTYHGTLLFCLAACIEALSEPFYILTQSMLQYHIRSRNEIIAMLGKVITTFLSIVVFSLPAPIGFAFGQLVYSLVLLVGYFLGSLSFFQRAGFFQRGGFSWIVILPWPIRDKSASSLFALSTWIGMESSSLLFAFTMQSFIKHCLTEGDRILLTFISTRSERGMFALVQNYGSLIARVVFQPIEETTRGAVSKLSKDGDMKKEMKSSISNIYLNMLKVVTTIGTTLLVLGPPFAYLGVKLLLGSQWANSQVPLALAAYCLYLLCMSFNGITEAVSFGLSSSRMIHQSTYILSISFGIYVLFAYFLFHMYSIPGLIIAGCLHMLARAFGSVYFLLLPSLELSFASFKSVFPHKETMFAMLLALIIAYCSLYVQWNAHFLSLYLEHNFRVIGNSKISIDLYELIHVIAGVVSFSIILIGLYTKERSDLMKVFRK
jgi:oligosaccharide translocation protein RFT1